MRAPRPKAPDRTGAFLAALAETCNVTEACKIARVDRSTIYKWRKEDKKFAKDWETTFVIASDLLEDEAVRRAKEGVEEPVYQGGKQVGTVRKYSDQLLMFLLKGAKKEKYSDRTTLASDPNAPVGLTIISSIPRPPKGEKANA